MVGWPKRELCERDSALQSEKVQVCIHVQLEPWQQKDAQSEFDVYVSFTLKISTKGKREFGNGLNGLERDDKLA